MKKLLLGVMLFSVGLLCMATPAHAQAVPVPCEKLQRVSDLTPGDHQVDGGVVTVGDDQTSLTISPSSGGTVCRFEALNSDGSTPPGGVFDGNHYSQTGSVDTIEFAFMPSDASGASNTNVPVLVGAGVFVALVAVSMFVGAKQVL